MGSTYPLGRDVVRVTETARCEDFRVRYLCAVRKGRAGEVCGPAGTWLLSGPDGKFGMLDRKG